MRRKRSPVKGGADRKVRLEGKKRIEEGKEGMLLEGRAAGEGKSVQKLQKNRKKSGKRAKVSAEDAGTLKQIFAKMETKSDWRARLAGLGELQDLCNEKPKVAKVLTFLTGRFFLFFAANLSLFSVGASSHFIDFPRRAWFV
jgi:hypothetical protein